MLQKTSIPWTFRLCLFWLQITSGNAFSVNAGVWLRMENKFFGNAFQLIVCFSWFDPEMVWSENFHFKPFSDSRAKRERDRTQITPRTKSPEPFDFAPFDFTIWLRLRITPRSHPLTLPANLEPRALWLRTLRLHCSTSTSNRTLQLRWRTQSPNHAFDFAPFDLTEIAPQDRTESAPIALIALRSQLRNG